MLTEHRNGRAPCALCGADIGHDDPAIPMPQGWIHVRCFPVHPLPESLRRGRSRKSERPPQGKMPEG
ncbi:MAG TPA: hypothetical protein VNK50_06025 [Calidithermus sp.]|nr:hypothetical protein [Calidithermus sp.]